MWSSEKSQNPRIQNYKYNVHIIRQANMTTRSTTWNGQCGDIPHWLVELHWLLSPDEVGGILFSRCPSVCPYMPKGSCELRNHSLGLFRRLVGCEMRLVRCKRTKDSPHNSILSTRPSVCPGDLNDTRGQKAEPQHKRILWFIPSGPLFYCYQGAISFDREQWKWPLVSFKRHVRPSHFTATPCLLRLYLCIS